MNLFKLLLLISILPSVIFAKDCGKIKTSKNDIIFTYLECEVGQTGCLELKDDKGEINKLDKNSKKSFKIKSANYKNLSIEFSLDKESACWFGDLTGNSIGKRLAIVANDKILTFPYIQSKIDQGILQLSGGISSTEKETEKLCRQIFKKCKKDLRPTPKAEEPIKGSFIDLLSNPPVVDSKELNKKFGTVMESYFWVTDKEVITVYPTPEFKDGVPFTVTMKVGENGKKIPLFYEAQEFNKETKKFVYAENAISIADKGWIKREEIVPYNILNELQDPEKIFSFSLLIDKCKDIFKSIKIKDQPENTSEEMVFEQEKIYRSNEVAYCSVKGDDNCQKFIGNLKDVIKDIDCQAVLTKKP